MKTREEILNIPTQVDHLQNKMYAVQYGILEVLLDIRDLLSFEDDEPRENPTTNDTRDVREVSEPLNQSSD